MTALSGRSADAHAGSGAQPDRMPILDLRAWFRPRGQSLLIDAGRVGCPYRGDADVESCFACGHLRTITSGRSPRVVCDFRPENRLAAFARRSG